MQENPATKPEITKDAEDILELYVDSMTIDSGLYTAILTFGELGRSGPALNHVRLRVSPHMLRAISLLTSKHVRGVRKQNRRAYLTAQRASA